MTAMPSGPPTTAMILVVATLNRIAMKLALEAIENALKKFDADVAWMAAVLI